MKIQTKIKWVVMLTLLASSFFFTGVAFASYLGLGHFGTNQMYRCHFGSYATQNQNASAKWSVTTDLDIYYSCSGNNVTTRVANYGNTGWAGNTYICTSGGCNTIYALQFAYNSCEAQSNTYFLSAYTNAKRQNVATHELGHCWSLNHNSRTTSVMQTTTTSIINPDSSDISDVNNRH